MRRDQAREIRSLAFSPDGQCLVSGGAARVIQVWDQTEWQENAGIHSPFAPRPSPPEAWTCLAVSPDGGRLASLGIGTTLRIWDTATTDQVTELGNAPLLHTFAASADGRWFAGSTASSEGTEDGGSRVVLWHPDSGRWERSLDGPTAPLAVLAFSADSTWLAAAELRSGDVRLWSIPDGEPQVLTDVVVGCSVEALAFDPHGRFLAIGGVDWLGPALRRGTHRFVGLARTQGGRRFARRGRSLAFDPSGRYLAAATLTQSIAVWDTERRRLEGEWIGHLDAVTCVAYSPDGRWLASGSDDRTLRLWEAATGLPRGLVELDTQIKALTFAPDGLSLFTGNGTTSCYQIEVRQILASEPRP